MNSYYCKLTQPNFNHLLKTIDSIFQKLDLVTENNMNDLNMTVAFKILHVTQRITLKDGPKSVFIVLMS